MCKLWVPLKPTLSKFHETIQTRVTKCSCCGAQLAAPGARVTPDSASPPHAPRRTPAPGPSMAQSVAAATGDRTGPELRIHPVSSV